MEKTLHEKAYKQFVSTVLMCASVMAEVHQVMVQSPEGECPIARNGFDLENITFLQIFVLQFFDRRMDTRYR